MAKHGEMFVLSRIGHLRRRPGKTTVAANTGYHRGEAGVSHRPNFSLPTMVYGSYSNGGGSEHVGCAGMAVEF